MCRQSFCWWCGADLENIFGLNPSTTYTDPIKNKHIVHERCLQEAVAHNKNHDPLPHAQKEDSDPETYIPSHRWKNEL